MAYDINELIVTNDETNERIKEGIEKNRKGNFTVKTDLKAGAKVRVKLKNHKFRFGCNIFMLDEIPNDKEKNEKYKEKLKELFNMATLPFYWDATEPEEKKTRYDKRSEKIYRRPPIDLCMEFCEKNGIEPREHGLCYEHFFPEWLKGKSDSEVKAHLEKRMGEISLRYADKIPTIEVTNEVFWGNFVTPFYFSPDFMEWCYKTAAKYFPSNKLCINEWTGAVWDNVASPWDNYYVLIENLLLKGCRIDAVGMQYHMFHRSEDYFNNTRKLYNLPHLFKVLDNYARFGKPVQITEVTIPAYTQNEEDEQSQADVIEKLYSLWFSYPNVEQIVYWNLVDGYAAFTTPGNMNDGENYYRGGLLRFDMSEKPAYKRLRHLIKEVWTTNEDVIADENGEIKFRGFFGEYEITADDKTYTLNLDKDGQDAIL
ncbi:MAG: endo-1,4-beta-xylanase [Eubacteriales bacterium]